MCEEAGTIHPLTKVQHEERLKSEIALINLVKHAKPAILRLNGVQMRNPRFKTPVLFLVPMSEFGGDKEQVLVALHGARNEVLNLRDMDTTRLWRIGLTTHAAATLAEKVKSIVEGNFDGSTETTTHEDWGED